MKYQQNQISQNLQASSLTVKQRWDNLNPFLRKGIIIVIVLLILSIITMIVLIAVVASWKPKCVMTQKVNYPVSGTGQTVEVKSVNVKEKKLIGQNVDVSAQVTTIREKSSRFLQEEPPGYVPYPSMISVNNGKGMIAQGFTETEVIFLVDPDRLILSHSTRLLQQTGKLTAADPDHNVMDFDDGETLRDSVKDSILKAAATSLEADPNDFIIIYEQTMTAKLKPDNTYQLEQIKQNSPKRMLKKIGGVRIGNIAVNNQVNIGLVNVLRSYAPFIADQTDSQFSKQTQIQVSVDIQTSRLLQPLPNSEVPPSSIADNSNIRYRSRPIVYRNPCVYPRVKIVNQAAFNCSLLCTGPKQARTCPKDLFKDNTCGYNTGKFTGKQKLRGRYKVQYNPEAAQQLRDKNNQDAGNVLSQPNQVIANNDINIAGQTELAINQNKNNGQ